MCVNNIVPMLIIKCMLINVYFNFGKQLIGTREEHKVTLNIKPCKGPAGTAWGQILKINVG